jgi:thymidylate synthase
MLCVTADSASELFAGACRAVLSSGRQASPRGLPTAEVLGAALVLTDPRRRLVDAWPTRLINPAFAAAETTWILSGSDAPWIYGYNERLASYADNGRLMGAYGPRLRRWHDRTDQLAQVLDALTSDPDSRRAVIQLYDPEADTRGYKDVPCTLGYRFFLRDGRLHMHTTMRSQDLWLGFCYDIFAATVLHELMAGWLGAQLGEYVLCVDSLHLYAADIPRAQSLPTNVPPGATMLPLATEWAGFDRLLSGVISGGVPGTQGWAELSAVMASYRARKSGDRDAARSLTLAVPGPLSAALGRWYGHLDAEHAAREAQR